jgi:hypothetical protein
MKTLLLCLAILGWQPQGSQTQTVIRVGRFGAITVNARGDMVELLHAPDTVSLPATVPGPGQDGSEWFVDVRNLGPNDVTIQGGAASTIQNGPQFTVLLHPKDVCRIRAAGSKYVISKRY